MAQWWECTPPSAYQCGPGSNPGVDAICGLGLLLVLSFAPRGFSPSTPVSRSPQKPIFPNSNSTRNQVDEYPLCGCAISKSLFIYFLLKFDRHPSKLVNINRQSSKLPPRWDTRDLKIRGRRRQRKRRWKSEFAFFQSSSRLLQVTNFVKCSRTLLKLNS